MKQFWLLFVLEYRHLQPFLIYLCLRQAELCLPIVYLLKGDLSIIPVKFGQGLDFEANHVLISFKTEIYLPEIFVLLYS
jgi:hypothetical protein